MRNFDEISKIFDVIFMRTMQIANTHKHAAGIAKIIPVLTYEVNERKKTSLFCSLA